MTWKSLWIVYTSMGNARPTRQSVAWLVCPLGRSWLAGSRADFDKGLRGMGYVESGEGPRSAGRLALAVRGRNLRLGGREEPAYE